MHTSPFTVHLHSLPQHLWHGGKHLLETVLVPLVLFYALYEIADFTGGILAALGWTVAAVVTRLVLRVRVPMVLWLMAAVLVGRTAVGFATGSAFLYFLQPSLQNFLIAFVLLASLPLERTFLAKLADDFCILPTEITGNARVQRFFRRVSLLWATVFAANGVGTLWALADTTVGGFVLVSTIGSAVLVAVGIAVSLLWFRSELRGEGIQLRFGGPHDHDPNAADPTPGPRLDGAGGVRTGTGARTS